MKVLRYIFLKKIYIYICGSALLVKRLYEESRISENAAAVIFMDASGSAIVKVQHFLLVESARV